MPSPKNQVIWSVSSLNHEVKTLLERGIGRLWLEGEISNLSKPASGHWYFSLKDQHAQIRVAMFKSKSRRVNFAAANGQHVLIQASVSLYEARGEFQVIAEHMEEAGTGRLMREFEALKNKLKLEGLFEATFKQSIPRYPQTIGIITSPTGAAIRDALSVLKRRCPATQVIIYPCTVQGAVAAKEIQLTLGMALQRNECDVLLMIRGGGSIEDMWCFNDERLAQLMYQSSIPIITGIGHEIDFTIADFVADFRAPTPSVAAESAAIDSNEIKQQLDFKTAHLQQLIHKQLTQNNTRLHHLHQRLLKCHPEHAINALKHRLQLLSIRLTQAMQLDISSLDHKVKHLHTRFSQATPQQSIKENKLRIDHLGFQLSSLIQKIQQQAQQKFIINAQQLDALSPLKTLSRGYASITKNQHSIKSVKQINVGDQVSIRIHDGILSSQVKSIKEV